MRPQCKLRSQPHDEVTGATTFRIDKGLDTGVILGTLEEKIQATDTADDLLTRLANAGGDLLVETMDGLVAGTITPHEQSGEPSYAHKIAVEDARVNWQDSAEAIDRHIRAHTPAPGAWTMLGEERVKLGPVSLIGVDPALEGVALAPGEAHITKKSVYVGTADAAVKLERLQVPGKKMMNAADWARGLGGNKEVRFS